jgi:hypothetical protein
MKKFAAIFCLLAISSTASAKTLLECSNKFEGFKITTDGENVSFEHSNFDRGLLLSDTNTGFVIQGATNAVTTTMMSEADARIVGGALEITMQDSKKNVLRISAVPSIDEPGWLDFKVDSTDARIKKIAIGAMGFPSASAMSFEKRSCSELK